MKTLVCSSIADISKEKWDALVPDNFPFASFDFLSALEKSKSLGARTGWYPQFITLYDKSKLIGALIVYLKTNSYGEYIFDWAWADAWQKTGHSYYPKLTSAIPFTPATGPKILISNQADYKSSCNALLKAFIDLQGKLQCSSSHVLFSVPKENNIAKNLNFTLRKTFQFHWKNNNYTDFDDFLAELKQKKRQKIRRERKEIQSNKNLKVFEVTGKEITQYADDFYELYLSTIDKKWSSDYLTEDFFKIIFQTLSDNILLYLAFENDILVAGTLNFYAGDKIYGRYWGAFKDIKHLHFELCYYRPIDFAIQRNLNIFEAGAQGEHKIQRGLIPQATYSFHYLPQTPLSKLIQQSISRETQQVDEFLKNGKSLVYKI